MSIFFYECLRLHVNLYVHISHLRPLSLKRSIKRQDLSKLWTTVSEWLTVHTSLTPPSVTGAPAQQQTCLLLPLSFTSFDFLAQQDMLRMRGREPQLNIASCHRRVHNKGSVLLHSSAAAYTGVMLHMHQAHNQIKTHLTDRWCQWKHSCKKKIMNVIKNCHPDTDCGTLNWTKQTVHYNRVWARAQWITLLPSNLPTTNDTADLFCI